MSKPPSRGREILALFTGGALMGRRLAFMLVLAMACLACKSSDPEADGRKLTADSTYDATEPIEHEGYRFRLEQPAKGWKLMRREDIQRFLATAVAGAVNGDGLFGAVVIEKLPGTTLDDAVALIDGQLPATEVESVGDIEFQGLTARRSVFSLEIEGDRFRYLRLIFLRGDYLYQLITWGHAATSPVSALEPFVNAFTLTEGEILGEEDRRAPVVEADGVTWRIRGGRYESALSGLSVPAVDGWRYVVGQEQENLNPATELMLTSGSTNAYISVISERYEGGDASALEAMIRRTVADKLGPGSEERSRTLAGHEVAFLRYENSALEFLIGVLIREDTMTQVWAVYPKALRAAAVPSFEQVIANMSFSTRAERDALHAELLTREGVVWKVGSDSAFLGHEFQDFRNHLIWRQPQGLYEVWVGDGAQQKSPNTVLWVQGSLDAINGRLRVFPGRAAGLADYHEEDASALEGRRDTEAVVDGVAVRASFGTRHVNDMDMSYGVFSAAHQGNAVTMTAWGPSSSLAPGTIEAVLGGLGLPASLPETSVEGQRFTDHLHGVSVSGPKGWSFSDETPADLPIGRIVKWKKGRAELSLVMTAATAMSDDEAWMASFTEQTMRDVMAKQGNLGKPETSQSTLDGHPSRRLIWRAAQAEVVLRNSVLYMFTAANVDDEVAERVRRSVKWHR